ncbi:MAG: type II toxin-antitoxin system RelE/ParE family toxin [Candidatus Yanofskybacteria bacterium]|nr:type II toxin-antitoxin system RelE/ParE family toxin [Candidatus Yanofskybacteria bacterium]
MNWELHVRNKVRKNIFRFPQKEQRRIALVLGELKTNPYAGDIEKLEGEENSWRRRIGNYRIFYDVYPEKSVIYVFRVERRTSKTY